MLTIKEDKGKEFIFYRNTMVITSGSINQFHTLFYQALVWSQVFLLTPPMILLPSETWRKSRWVSEFHILVSPSSSRWLGTAALPYEIRLKRYCIHFELQSLTYFLMFTYFPVVWILHIMYHSLFFRRLYYFRAVLGLQQKWEEGRDFSLYPLPQHRLSLSVVSITHHQKGTFFTKMNHILVTQRP